MITCAEQSLYAKTTAGHIGLGFFCTVQMNWYPAHCNTGRNTNTNRISKSSCNLGLRLLYVCHAHLCPYCVHTCVSCVGTECPLINYRERKKICIEMGRIGEVRHLYVLPYFSSSLLKAVVWTICHLL